MNKNRYGFVVGGLFVVWTAVILLLSLVPGDELPPAGWLARIPHFDKIVHCGFYLSETGVVFYYAPYEIASYAEGFPEVTIPYSELEMRIELSK